MPFFNNTTFQETKKIREGRSAMKKEFLPLAEWICNTYKVMPLNIVCPQIIVKPLEPGKREKKGDPSVLEIIFEHKAEADRFLLKGGSIDSNKQQAVKDAFYEKVIGEEYRKRDIWVTFRDFESGAKHDVLESIPMSEIQAIEEKHKNENIWKIAKYLYISVFVFTEEQRKIAMSDGTEAQLRKELFALVKRYDTFNYYTPENFIFYLDSKEVFDKDFQGSWWYYYK